MAILVMWKNGVVWDCANVYIGLIDVPEQREVWEDMNQSHCTVVQHITFKEWCRHSKVVSTCDVCENTPGGWHLCKGSSTYHLWSSIIEIGFAALL